MIRKGIIVTAIFLFSTLIQLVTQILVTRLFGASQDLDVFLAAVAIPSIIVTVLYGTLNNVLLPILGEKTDDRKLISYVLSLSASLGLISLGAMLMLFFGSDLLAKLLYAGREAAFVDAVAFQMQLLSFSIPFAVIATILGAYFYTKKQFYRFPVAQLVGSIVNLALIFFLMGDFGIWALVIGFIVNIAIQILFVLPPVGSGIKLRLVPVMPIILAWIPLLIGNFAFRSDTLLMRSYASYLPTGYIVYINLIMKIVSIATSVMTIGIQVLLLPHLVDYFRDKQYKKAERTVFQSKVIAIAVASVIIASIVLIGPFIIKLLFEGGRFTRDDVELTVSLLPYFILPAIGWGIHGVFMQPLYALKLQYHIGAVNVAALALAWMITAYINQMGNPMLAIAVGLIVLLFTGIIGSEIIWQQHKRKLRSR